MTVTAITFGCDVIQNEGQNKIMFFYTVKFVNKLNKDTNITNIVYNRS